MLYYTQIEADSSDNLFVQVFEQNEENNPTRSLAFYQLKYVVYPLQNHNTLTVQIDTVFVPQSMK